MEEQETVSEDEHEVGIGDALGHSAPDTTGDDDGADDDEGEAEDETG